MSSAASSARSWRPPRPGLTASLFGAMRRPFLSTLARPGCRRCAPCPGRRRSPAGGGGPPPPPETQANDRRPAGRLGGGSAAIDRRSAWTAPLRCAPLLTRVARLLSYCSCVALFVRPGAWRGLPPLSLPIACVGAPLRGGKMRSSGWERGGRRRMCPLFPPEP